MSQGSDYEESASHRPNEEEMVDEALEDHGIEVEKADDEAMAEEAPKVLLINQKIGDRTCATYTFVGEDHTLGNLLRYALIKNPDVDFCGYSITHPSEKEMNLRLQTTGKI